jgi:hypothetical protein
MLIGGMHGNVNSLRVGERYELAHHGAFGGVRFKHVPVYGTLDQHDIASPHYYRLILDDEGTLIDSGNIIGMLVIDTRVDVLATIDFEQIFDKVELILPKIKSKNIF